MIYINHGERQLQNAGEDGLFNHDPGLDGKCIPECKKLCKILVSLYGYPVKIVTSPYRVCRETTIVLGNILKTLNEKEKDIDVVVDTSLSYYLGNLKHLNINVTPQTQFYRPSFHENYEEMKTRVEKHVTAQKKYFTKKNGPVWYITHSNILAEIFNLSHPEVCSPSFFKSLATPFFAFCMKEVNDYKKLDLIKIK